MKEELITQVAKMLNDWNPLGDAASTVEGLDGYRIEAIDIISTITIVKGINKVEESIEQVLIQAFNIELNEAKLNDASVKIRELLNSRPCVH